jgi:fluoride exporter
LNLRNILLVGFGGFAGSVARYVSSLLINRFLPSVLPLGTLSVNIAGCFLIGLIFGFAEKGNVLSPEWRLLLATGFCGGFTTFSSLSYESVQLINDSEYLYLAGYIVLSFIIGISATIGGVALTKLI